MALETMIISKNPEARKLSEQIAKSLSSDEWMSTQTTAYSLLAMAKMVEANGGKDMNFSYSFGDQTETITTKSTIAQRELAVVDGSNTLT